MFRWRFAEGLHSRFQKDTKNKLDTIENELAATFLVVGQRAFSKTGAGRPHHWQHRQVSVLELPLSRTICNELIQRVR